MSEAAMPQDTDSYSQQSVAATLDANGVTSEGLTNNEAGMGK